ncbi:hypothetical protein EV361DRAFT_1037612, partial [Lentinula raphanica]
MSRYSTSSLGILSTRNFKRTRNLSAQAKKSYQQFFKKNFKQIKVYYPHCPGEVPTAPPSPSPVPQDSRKLRRHETFYYQEHTHRNKLIQTDQEKSADLHQVDLEECYLEVALQNTPIEDIPKGMSREAFVMQR